MEVERRESLTIVREMLAEAAATAKCRACGCLHQVVDALERVAPRDAELVDVLAKSRAAFVAQKYDCLGCSVCFPAVAENAFADAYPSAAGGAVCATASPVERAGWPPLPGDYQVTRYNAPVAVCALTSDNLVDDLAQRQPAGMSIVGTLRTENLGIERVIRNVLANPNIRFLVLCGDDTRQAVGHLPGQSLASLFENGVDQDGRIRGAKGKRPFLKNVTREQVAAFVSQVEMVPLVGENDSGRIVNAVQKCATRDPGPKLGATCDAPISPFHANDPERLVLDPAGFVVIFPDERRGLVVEHYTNNGVLHCVVEGSTAAAVGAAAAERGLVSRLDHAVYLGRELARAEESLRTGSQYIQDRAPGMDGPAPQEDCVCAGST